MCTTPIRFIPRTRRLYLAVAATMVLVLATGVVGVLKGSPVPTGVGLVLVAIALPTSILSLITGRAPVLILREDHIKIRGTPPIRYDEIAAIDVRLLAGREVLCLALRDPNRIPPAWRWWRRYGIRNLLDVSVGLTRLETEPKQIVSHVYVRLEGDGTANGASGRHEPMEPLRHGGGD